MLGSWVPTPCVTAWLVQNASGEAGKQLQADDGVAAPPPRQAGCVGTSRAPAADSALALHGARQTLPGPEPPPAPPTGAQARQESQHSAGQSQAYLPVQEGCDQAEVLRVLHEPAEREGQGGLLWVLALTPSQLGCHALRAQSSKASSQRDSGL